MQFALLLLRGRRILDKSKIVDEMFKIVAKKYRLRVTSFEYFATSIHWFFQHAHHHISERPAIVVRWLLLPFIVLLLFFSVGNCLPLIGNPQTCQNSDRPVVIICYLLIVKKDYMAIVSICFDKYGWKLKWNGMTSCLRVFAIFVAVFEILKYQEYQKFWVLDEEQTLWFKH